MSKLDEGMIIFYIERIFCCKKLSKICVNESFLEKGHIFWIPISTMQMIIFDQSYFFSITVSFHDNISEKRAQIVQNISCLCKWCSRNNQTSKLFFSYYLFCYVQNNKIKSSWCAEEPLPWYKRFFICFHQLQ